MERPVVAFYDIEAEIHAKAKQGVDDYAPEDSSESEDEDQDEDGNPATRDREFELDEDINLSSPFLRNMLSDEQPAPVPGDTRLPAVAATYTELRNREPTEEEWENM